MRQMVLPFLSHSPQFQSPCPGQYRVLHQGIPETGAGQGDAGLA